MIEGEKIDFTRPDFTLIGHPFDLDHLYRYLQHLKPDFKRPSDQLLLKLFEWTPPYQDKKIEIKSRTGALASGRIIVCPLLPEMVKETGRSKFRNLCIEKVIDSLKLSARQGAKISGLGGFTSIADGDQGRLVARRVNGLAVTSGNTLTAMAAVKGLISAAEQFGIDIAASTAVVVGAAGDIGTGCCRYLAVKVKRLILASCFSFNLEKIARELKKYNAAEIIVENNNQAAVHDAELVITAASSVAPFFRQDDFKEGAIVCDVGYPKNIFSDYNRQAASIFLFSGGLLKAPVSVKMPCHTELPGDDIIYGCWGEAIILALEKKIESFSLGRGLITPEKMELIWGLAQKHGFDLAPFF